MKQNKMGQAFTIHLLLYDTCKRNFLTVHCILVKMSNTSERLILDLEKGIQICPFILALIIGRK
jgi:hypothetical protein